MILVPKCSLKSFLHGRSATNDQVKKLFDVLQKGMEKKGDDPTAQELLVQICQSCLSENYTSDEQKDLYIGPVAAAAVFMGDAPLFAKTLDQTAEGFDKASYSTLGELVCLQDLVIPEDE